MQPLLERGLNAVKQIHSGEEGAQAGEINTERLPRFLNQKQRPWTTPFKTGTHLEKKGGQSQVGRHAGRPSPAWRAQLFPVPLPVTPSKTPPSPNPADVRCNHGTSGASSEQP